MAAKVTEKVQHNENPLLRLILQKYTETARNSIHGPVALKDDFPQVSLKNTTQRSTNAEIPIEFQFRTTNLEGYTVGCFIIGGEKRLCFTELVHTVLKDINVQQIFEKRDKLLIFTSKCSLKQLDELKYNGVLPWTSSSSNLITKSDAYRLIGALQSHLAPKDTSKSSPTSFGVYHECFGGCTGTFDTELYVKPQSLCIKCEECKGLFSPPSFTSHSHTTFDNIHTCHWGFDTVRWRSYLMLVEEQVSEDLLKIWNNVKLKFNVNNSFKNHSSDKDQDSLKYTANKSRDYVRPLEIFSSKYACQQKDNHSAFQPWSFKSKQHTDNSINCSKSNKFTMIQKPSHSNILSAYPCSTKAGKSHGNCRFQSSAYMDCVQCKSAIESECSTFCGLAQVSDKLDEDVKPKIEPNFNNSYDNFSEEKLISVELSINKTLEKYLSKDIRSTADVKELTQKISAEFKQLHISQVDRLQEELIINQRLKTELQLIKMESDKKLADMRDTKDRIEQELETLHRERQKEISLFNQMRWELNQEVSKRKLNKEEDLETMRKENLLLKMQLEQITIDRENLHKQLTWQLSKKKTQSWTPFPSMARKFSESEEEEYTETNSFKRASSHYDPTMSNSVGHLSPALKTRRMDYSRTTTQHQVSVVTAVSDDNSDIEVED